MELIQYQEMREAIVRVRELHKAIYISPNEYVCELCTDIIGSYRDYPCETIQALDGEQ
jgi:hypothetical protein